jgi:hypothetical protein
MLATTIILLQKNSLNNCHSAQWRRGQVPLPAQLWVVSSKPASFKKNCQTQTESPTLTFLLPFVLAETKKGGKTKKNQFQLIFRTLISKLT